MGLSSLIHAGLDLAWRQAHCQIYLMSAICARKVYKKSVKGVSVWSDLISDMKLKVDPTAPPQDQNSNFFFKLFQVKVCV